MRITRNYRNGLMNPKNVNGNNSLFRQALSRNSASRRGGRAASILNSMNKTNSSAGNKFATDTKTDKFYFDMEYHAGQVKEYADALADTEKDSIYDKAKESGNTEEIQSRIRSFVTQYNKMLDDLEESGTRADNNLRTQINSMSNTFSEQLASTGVIRKPDGTLVIDEKKLAAADVDTLKKVWSGQSSFAGRASDRADSVEATAQKNRQAQVSNNYLHPFDRANLYANYGSKGNYFNFLR